MSANFESVYRLMDSYGSNHKQALKECEKKISRDPKNCNWVYWRALLLTRLNRHAEALENLQKLCHWSPPLTHRSVMAAIHEDIYSLQLTQNSPAASAGKDAQQMWQNACKASGKSHATQLWKQLFSTATSCQHWADALLALNMLKKAEPSNTKWALYHILATQLSSDALILKDPKMGNLQRELAYRSARKELEQARGGTELASSPLAGSILKQLFPIYRRQQRQTESKALLHSFRENIYKESISSRLYFAQQQIDILAEERSWQELYDFSKLLLNSRDSDPAASTFIENDTFWWHAIRSASELAKLSDGNNSSDKADYAGLISGLIEAHPEGTPPWVSLGSLFLEGNNPQGSAVEQLGGFFDTYLEEEVCFRESRLFLSRCSKLETSRFLKHIKERADIAWQINGGNPPPRKHLTIRLNYLKFKYLISFTDSQEVTEKRPQELVLECLELYKRWLGNASLSPDQACILAVVVLLRLHILCGASSSPSSQLYLVQAITLLRTLILEPNTASQYADDYRHPKVIAVSLLHRIGLGALAFEVYESVRVKEILNEAVSHVLLTRISTLHPYLPNQLRFKVPDATADPIKKFRDVLRLNIRFSDRISNLTAEALFELGYDKIRDLEKLNDRLQHSVFWASSLIEARRVARMRSEPVDGELAGLVGIQYYGPNDVASTLDNREFRTPYHADTGFIDILDGEGSVYEGIPSPCLEIGPRPYKYWLANFIKIDDLYCLIDGESQLLASRDSVAQILHDASDAEKSELSHAEQSIMAGWDRLAPVVKAIVASEGEQLNSAKPAKPSPAKTIQPSKSDQAALAAEVKALEDYLKTLRTKYTSPGTFAPSPAAPLPTAEVIQPVFLTLEFLKATAKLCSRALGLLKRRSHPLHKTKLTAKQFDALKVVIQETFSAVARKGAKWQQWLGNEGTEVLTDMIVAGETGAYVGRICAVAAWGKEEGTPVGPESMKSHVRGHAQRYVEAAVDTLDGILKVKL